MHFLKVIYHTYSFDNQKIIKMNDTMIDVFLTMYSNLYHFTHFRTVLNQLIFQQISIELIRFYFLIFIQILFSQQVQQVVCPKTSSFSNFRNRSHCFSHLICKVSQRIPAALYLVISLSCFPKSDRYIEQSFDLSMQYRSSFSIYIKVAPLSFRLINS